jgi:hypothetical protein
VQTEQAGQLREIALPATRRDDPTAAHEEAVAHVDRRVRIGVGAEHRTCGVIEVRHAHRVAAIHDVDQHASAAPRAVDRQQEREIGGELDEAAWGRRCQRDVGDAAVGGVVRIEGEAQATFQLLVGARVAERLAVGQRATQGDIERDGGHVRPPISETAVSTN